MKIEFEKDLAQDAVECEVGRVITQAGQAVSITNWNYEGSIPGYVLEGFVEGNSWPFHWTKEGRWSLATTSLNDLCLDVNGELFNTIESDAD